MSGVVRIGVAGAGYFGRFHAQKVAQGARSVLVGVHDPDAGRAGALAAEMGCAALGWDEMLAGCDAVVVASPAAAHFGAASAALAAFAITLLVTSRQAWVRACLLRIW